MRISAEQLSTHIVVKRAPTGMTFMWEVHRDDSATPVFVSPEKYRGMDAAYRAGTARLAEFIPSKRTVHPGFTLNRVVRPETVAATEEWY
jgi:hypothetical protein